MIHVITKVNSSFDYQILTSIVDFITFNDELNVKSVKMPATKSRDQLTWKFVKFFWRSQPKFTDSSGFSGSIEQYGFGHVILDELQSILSTPSARVSTKIFAKSKKITTTVQCWFIAWRPRTMKIAMKPWLFKLAYDWDYF